ncbi:MAG: sensor histidine kinase, partial [Flammeovirgaceae bacterium]
NVFLKTCAQEAIHLLSLQKEKQTVHYHNHLAENLFVKADDQRLIQVFVNLLSNARDASPPEGDILIEGRLKHNRVEFSVTDYGTGIPQEHINQIFEPFFTTKEAGQGTGLGLAMVYSIIEDHQGALEILSPAHSDTQNGTRFIISLP